MEIVLIKTDSGTFAPATDIDYSESAKIQPGQAIRVEAKRIKPRSLQHHRLYWSGLIELIAQYWEPKESFLASHERDVMNNFVKWLKASGTSEDSVQAVSDILKLYADSLEESRADKLPPAEVSKQAIHEWLKLETGHWDYIDTPKGKMRKARSINFNAMDQHQFNEFWIRAVNVAWRFVLSRQFESETDVNNAIDQLMGVSF